jgi:hypothetical protein
MANLQIKDLTEATSIQSEDKFALDKQTSNVTRFTEWQDMVSQMGTDLSISSKTDKVSSPTDNTIVRFNGTTGAQQTSNVVIDDNDYIYGYGGLAQVLTAGENLSAGDVCYLKASDGKYWKAKADAEATSSTQLRLALASINADATGLFLAFGKYTTTGLTIGSVYLSAATGGARVTTAPSASTNVQRQIGSNQSATEFFFRPDSLYITLA